MKAIPALEDGSVFHGQGFGARAHELLDRAKHAVEIAIEQDEKAALKILEK